MTRPTCCSVVEKLRLGCIKSCLPNEDLGKRNQPYATHPLFLDNLHFDHFVQSVNIESRLTLWTKWSKWILSKKRGWVAYGWTKQRIGRVFSMHFARVWVLDLGYECLQNHSKRHARHVSFSQIVVWEHRIIRNPACATHPLFWTITISLISTNASTSVWHCGEQKSRTFRPRSKWVWKT